MAVTSLAVNCCISTISTFCISPLVMRSSGVERVSPRTLCTAMPQCCAWLSCLLHSLQHSKLVVLHPRIGCCTCAIAPARHCSVIVKRELLRRCGCARGQVAHGVVLQRAL